MKRMTYILVLCLVAVGCSLQPPRSPVATADTCSGENTLTLQGRARATGTVYEQQLRARCVGSESQAQSTQHHKDTLKDVSQTTVYQSRDNHNAETTEEHVEYGGSGVRYGYRTIQKDKDSSYRFGFQLKVGNK